MTFSDQMVSGCHFFTFYMEQCYLLATCDTLDTCTCCVSGPGDQTSQDVADCLPCVAHLSTTTTTTPTTSTAVTTPQPTSATDAATTAISTTTAVSPTATATASTGTTTAGYEECAEAGWTRYQGGCYKIITGHQHIAECNAECMNYTGGRMVSIHRWLARSS